MVVATDMVFWKSITKDVALLNELLTARLLTGRLRISLVVVNVPKAEDEATPWDQTVAALPTDRTKISTSRDHETPVRVPAL
jgi:hypothetical protein